MPDSSSQQFLRDLDKKLAQRARRVRMPGQRPKQSNPTTRRLAAMNMAIRGIDFNFGKEPANSFTSDQLPDLRADFVMANPPFDVSDWWDAKLEGDLLWKYGTPPKDNVNFPWSAHAPPPRAARQHGASPCQWHQQRLRRRVNSILARGSVLDKVEAE